MDREPQIEREPLAIVEINAARHSFAKNEQLSAAGMEAAVAAGADVEGEGHSQVVRERLEAGETLEVHGSLLERTIQSSLLRMLSEHFKDVDFSMVDPKELTEWLAASDQIKIQKDAALLFKGGSGAFQEAVRASYRNKEQFKWIVENSDQLAIESGQIADQVETLSTLAANVALYLSSLGLKKSQEIIEAQGQEAELVFLTSHQSILESFLYKVVLMKEGDEAAAEFVESLSNLGFAENQGFKIRFELLDQNSWQMKLLYGDKEYQLEMEDIEAIIKEGIDVRQQLVQPETEA